VLAVLAEALCDPLTLANVAHLPSPGIACGTNNSAYREAAGFRDRIEPRERRRGMIVARGQLLAHWQPRNNAAAGPCPHAHAHEAVRQ
jgi:hypothetical protein